MAFRKKAFPKENITKEFEPVGERRIRIIDGRAIDIREYVEAESFTGFTRKGIRVNRDEAKAIVAAMQEFIEGGQAKVPTVEYQAREAEFKARVEPKTGWDNASDPIPMVFEAAPGVQIHKVGFGDESDPIPMTYNEYYQKMAA